MHEANLCGKESLIGRTRIKGAFGFSLTIITASRADLRLPATEGRSRFLYRQEVAHTRIGSRILLRSVKLLNIFTKTSHFLFTAYILKIGDSRERFWDGS